MGTSRFPFSAPNTLVITIALASTTPTGPNSASQNSVASGVCESSPLVFAVMAACGSTRWYARFAPQYSAMRTNTASKSARGMLRLGSFTSSAMGAMFIQPLYAHSTPTSATPRPLQLIPFCGSTGTRCAARGGCDGPDATA